MENQNEFIIKLALDAWQLQIERATKLFDSLTDEQLQKQVAPNRNTGLYLLGHLTAIHDAMFSLLGTGERLHHELDGIFVKNPERSKREKPTVAQLRIYWKEVNSLLNLQLASLKSNDWLDRHHAVSAEDFKNAPHRNKLSILLIRTSHIAYHLGQLTFLRSQDTA